MWLECALSFLIFLQFDCFSCLGDVNEHFLVSNNYDRHHGGWHVSEKIHELCFNPATRVIILRDNWHEKQSKFLTSISDNLSPSYIFGKEVNETLQKFQRLRNVYKLKPIHLSQKSRPATSVTIFIDHEGIDLSLLLQSLRSSIWWNSRAKFLLVGLGKSMCILASKLSRAIWDFSVLSAIYLCQNDENKWNVYTFNPYSHWAPNYWTPVDWDSRGHEGWSLFQHVDEEIDESMTNNGPQLCKTLFFDKVHDLNAHTFRALDRYNHESIDYIYRTDVGYKRRSRREILANVLNAMKVTYTVKFINYKGNIKDNEQPYDNTNELITGKIDFGLFRMFIRDYWWLQTYPYMYSKLNIVSSNHSRYAMNFFKIFIPSSWILLWLLVVLTILSLKYLLKSTFESSVVEFVRIFVSQATIREPIGDFQRACFIFPIYLWLIVNIYMQSFFEADKMAVDQIPKIDSLEQLINSNLSVHGLSSHEELIFNEEIRQRFVHDPIPSCIKSLFRGELVACLIPAPMMHIHIPKNAPVHVSKEHLTERGLTWFFPGDSPLLSKVNTIMSRLSQAGLLNYHFPIDKNDFQSNEQIKFELLIALRILIGGWLLALIVAVIEIVVGLINHLHYALYIS